MTVYKQGFGSRVKTKSMGGQCEDCDRPIHYFKIARARKKKIKALCTECIIKLRARASQRG